MKNWDRATVLAILAGGILIGFASAMGVVAITNASSYQEPPQQVAKSQEPQVNQVAQEPAKQLPEVEQPKSEPPPPSNQPTEKEKEFVRKLAGDMCATGAYKEIGWKIDTASESDFYKKTMIRVREDDRIATLYLRSTNGATWRTGHVTVAFYQGTDLFDLYANVDGRTVYPMNTCPLSKKEEIALLQTEGFGL